MEYLAVAEMPEFCATTAKFGILFNKWLMYVDRTPKTIQTYTRAIRQFYNWLDANNINQPNEFDIRHYRDELLTDHKPTTAQAYLTAVKLFFKWTAKEGIYPNISERVTGVKIDNTLPKKSYLTVEQAQQLLKAPDATTLKGKRDRAILALMLTTGLRTVEVCRADIGDIGNIGNDRALYIKGKGKADKTQTVKITGAVDAAIIDYLKARGGNQSDADPLFCSSSNHNNGGRLDVKSISRIVKTALVAIGLNSERYTAHSLRHTAGTQNILNGGTLAETQQLLRHSAPTTTMIYINVVNRVNNNSEQRLTDIFIK